jgi:hypothetical protein
VLFSQKLTRLSKQIRLDQPLQEVPIQTETQHTTPDFRVFHISPMHRLGIVARRLLRWTGAQITARIRNGKKGQMTAFVSKSSADRKNEVKDYVLTLK